MFTGGSVLRVEEKLLHFCFANGDLDLIVFDINVDVSCCIPSRPR